ncbi:MAG: ATP--guanido phosphotransferase, partial [Planctomycetaceae bacterium]|nr:ATP--guanido phosphotransferase [Planctomycetaceae bacterium]
MDLDSLLTGTSGWLSGHGDEADVVVSSRIRLARNLAQFPFLTMADHQARREIESQLREAITPLRDESLPKTSSQAEQKADNPAATDSNINYVDMGFIDVESLNAIDRQFLMERQLISRELSEASGPRGVVVGNKQQTSLMINEEDHLRMQVLRSGFNLDDCWSEINHLDDAIESRV